MMELTQVKTIKIVAALLLLSAITQPIYTALFLGAPDVASRQALWGLEGLVFVFLVAFAGSALVMAKRYTLGFSAIAFAAILNVVQVGVGYTLFKPFGEAAQANAELGAVSFAVVLFGFFIYNAAKILLGLAAVVFCIANSNQGRKVLGGLTAIVGAVDRLRTATDSLVRPLDTCGPRSSCWCQLLLLLLLFFYARYQRYLHASDWHHGIQT